MIEEKRNYLKEFYDKKDNINYEEILRKTNNANENEINETIKEIYEDYKKYDNNKKSLLDSIHDYINKNEQNILKQVSKAFEL